MTRTILKQSFFALLAVMALAGCGTVKVTAVAPMPNASSLVTRCAAAYDALKSYHCHASVTTKSMIVFTMHASADITFARPGKIRADCSDSNGNSFVYFTDGKTVKENFLGGWKTDKDIEMAIGGATGVTQSAGTTVPALLLHTAWGYPFGRGTNIDPKVTAESVDGHPCYCVHLTGATNPICWIDKKTLLLDRIDTSFSGISDSQIITNQQVNPEISAAAFTQAGAK